MNKSNSTLIKAYILGYRAKEDGSIISYKGTAVSERISIRGYKTFCVDRYSICVHRFVAFQKYGDKIFKDGIVVRHLNGCRLDNRLENIEIGTYSDNMFDIHPKLRVKYATNASRKMQDSIRSKELRYKIYNDLIDGIPYKEISKKYGVAKSTLSCMKNKSKEYREYKDALSLTINYSLMKRHD